MSPLRAPTVGGLAGGVGATTVARALHAREIGRVGDAGRLPDVVVCRATRCGLALAERPETAGSAPAPVLAVTAAGGDPDDAVVARLAAVGAGWSGPVVLPRVGHWDVSDDPYADAAGLLGRSTPPAPLARYAEALGEIVALLTASGRLEIVDDERDSVGALRPVRGIRIGVPGTAW
ncbi:hypothetical protein [Pseudonocardia endophytica]|uniref:Uncharacterized protein n=1 Tax=Pseudonocardia endophytica TaxID=401976 RepID=A0A4R1HX50_PSEEN|nr:hypothetical protein [Pseudonocardia endophytica]TCK26938.1 hypothetical protein EV378_2784 [Pseudonocardia endophytica]